LLNQIDKLLEKIKEKNIETSKFWKAHLEGFEAIRGELEKDEPDLDRLRSLLYGSFRSLSDAKSDIRYSELGKELELLANQIYDSYIEQN
jgi:predicted nuclease with TOPRIM domain